MTGSLAGKRYRWEDWVQYLEYTPVKGYTFTNIGMESHLKLLHYNKIAHNFDLSLRPDFYFRHFEQILSDNPHTDVTKEHYEEAVPFAIESIQKYYNASEAQALQMINKYRRETLEKLGRNPNE